MKISLHKVGLPARWLSITALIAIVVMGAGGATTASHAKAAGSTRVLYERRADANTLDLSVNSSSADGPVKTVRVLVPNGWSKNSAKTWPTLWLLHGGMDDSSSWLKGTDIKNFVAHHNIMVVIPDTSWCSAYTDWWNYDKTSSPAWETYITSDLRDLMATQYHASSTNAAVAGPSMGGLGALKLAEQHPDMFKAAASFSGNVDPLHAYDNMADGPDYPGLSCLADWKRVWGDYTVPAQRAIWERNDPYVQASKLANLRYVYVSSGDGLTDPLQSEGGDTDPVEQQINTQAHALVQKMNSLDIPVDAHFYAGNHTWTYWSQELNHALPEFLKVLGAE
jgi:S-formylglutathione hydrolase FrmB